MFSQRNNPYCDLLSYKCRIYFNIQHTGNRNELKINEFKFEYDINDVGLLGLKKLNQILLKY